MAFKKKSRGKKLSKLERSNRAHERLRKMHLDLSKKTNWGNHYEKSDYHWLVKNEQSKCGRILTKNEKRGLFEKAIRFCSHD